MNSKQITGLLVNEWQLGSQLNVAVTDGAREKFNLLLSLLSSDARDFAQFDYTAHTDVVEQREDLRHVFSLSEAQPLLGEGISLEQATHLNQLSQHRDVCALRLQTLLNNEPILSRASQAIIDSEVMDNVSLLTQARLTRDEQLQSATSSHEGIDHSMMEVYQSLQGDSKPIKVNYFS